MTLFKPYGKEWPFLRGKGPLPFWFVDLLLIGGLAAVIRLAYFRGFGEADDANYALLARMLLAGYKPFKHVWLWEGRPGVIIPTAISVLLFGWTEWAVILPTFALSLIEIAACYWIALKAEDRRTAVGSALALTFFSFHWSYSTTVCADIMGSALFWLGAALAADAWARASNGKRPIEELAAGLVMGLSFSIKVNTAFAFVPLALMVPAIIPVLDRQAPKHRAAHLKQVAWISLGAAIGLAGVLGFFWIFSHDPFAGVRGELTFNRQAYAQLYAADWKRLLHFYPDQMLLGLHLADGAYVGAPFGTFFILACGAAVAAFWRGPAWVRIAAVWLVTLFMLYEFWPLTLHPYAPIHRLARHLAPLAVPGALLIGWAFIRMWETRGLWKLMAVSLGTLYLWTSWASVHQSNQYHRECMMDARAAYRFVKDYWQGPVACSKDLLDFFLMRSPDFALRRPIKILNSSFTVVPPGYLVIMGGMHRPTGDFAWYEIGRPAPGLRWIEIGRRESGRRMAGIAPLRFYLVDGPQVSGLDHRNDPFVELATAACGGPHWRLRDRIDFGDSQSIRDHQVRDGESSVRIARRLPNDQNEQMVETGLYVRNFVTYRAHNLQPDQPLCIASLVAPDADNETRSLTINGRQTPLRVTRTSVVPMGRWAIGIVQEPGSALPGADLEIREWDPNILRNWQVFRTDFYQRDRP